MIIFTSNNVYEIPHKIPHWSNSCYTNTIYKGTLVSNYQTNVSSDATICIHKFTNASDMILAELNAWISNCSAIIFSIPSSKFKDADVNYPCSIPSAYVDTMFDEFIQPGNRAMFSFGTNNTTFDLLLFAKLIAFFILMLSFIRFLTYVHSSHQNAFAIHVNNSDHDTDDEVTLISTSSELIYDSLPNNDTDTCSICIQNYEIGHKLIKLECGHIFHADCIREWIGTKNRCPLCNHEQSV